MGKTKYNMENVTLRDACPKCNMHLVEREDRALVNCRNNCHEEDDWPLDAIYMAMYQGHYDPFTRHKR